jgi:uncharacterized protein (TIGR02466 family)
MQEARGSGYRMLVSDYFPTTIAKVYMEASHVLNPTLYACIQQRRKADLSGEPIPGSKPGWNIKNGWEIGPAFFESFAGVPCVDTLRMLVEHSTLQFVNDYHLQLCHFSKPQRAGTIVIGASYVTALEENAFLTDEHVHYGTDFVGIYYLRVPLQIDGRDDGAGFLILRDPRPAMHVTRLDHQKTLEAIRPDEGMLLLFPGYLSHAVRPFWGSGERISINFNIKVSLRTDTDVTAATEV